MFCLNDSMRYFLCPGYTDMRKGMFTLCGLVHERMGGDIRSGEVFIFYNRFRKAPSRYPPIILPPVLTP